jgi:hypothetical protein
MFICVPCLSKFRCHFRLKLEMIIKNARFLPIQDYNWFTYLARKLSELWSREIYIWRYTKPAYTWRLKTSNRRTIGKRIHRYTERFSSYLTENTLCFSSNNHSVNAVKEYSRCEMCESSKSCKYTVCTKCRNLSTYYTPAVRILTTRLEKLAWPFVSNYCETVLIIVIYLYFGLYAYHMTYHRNFHAQYFRNVIIIDSSRSFLSLKNKTNVDLVSRSAAVL